jgi:hypothetical protein
MLFPVFEPQAATMTRAMTDANVIANTDFFISRSSQAKKN